MLHKSTRLIPRHLPPSRLPYVVLQSLEHRSRLERCPIKRRLQWYIAAARNPTGFRRVNPKIFLRPPTPKRLKAPSPLTMSSTPQLSSSATDTPPIRSDRPRPLQRRQRWHRVSKRRYWAATGVPSSRVLIVCEQWAGLRSMNIHVASGRIECFRATAADGCEADYCEEAGNSELLIFNDSIRLVRRDRSPGDKLMANQRLVYTMHPRLWDINTRFTS